MGKRGSNSSSPPHGTSSGRGHKKRTYDARRHHVHHSPRVNQNSHLKRARHGNHNKIEVESCNYALEGDSSNLVHKEMRHDGIDFPHEMEPVYADKPTFEYISSDDGENIAYESANSQTGRSFETEGESIPQIGEHNTQRVENNPIDDQRFEGLGLPATMEPLQNLVSVENFVFKVLGAQVNRNRREFITKEIEGVFNILYSAETPAQLLTYRSEVHETLRILWSMVDVLGCGEPSFKQFAGCVDRIFDLAVQHSKSSAYIEALGDVNVDLIQNLIRQHEECLTTKQAVEVQLTEAAKKLDDLDVKEATIKEAEERVHKMREEHEAAKSSLIMQKMDLEVSLEHQNAQAAQLQQSRIDAREDLLPQIGSTRLSMKTQEREIRQLVNSLFSSCCEL